MHSFRRASVLAAVLIWSQAAAFSLLPSQAKEKKIPLNVLLVTIDTLRPDRLSCYSQEHVQTPNIDGLAAKGVLFTRAFAHTPTTLPSHTNILLGTTPLYHGVHDNQNFIVREEFLTLAEHLKDHGYATGAFVGAFPLDSRFGLTQGFDVYDDNYGSKNYQEFSYVERKGEVVIEKALEWLTGRRSPWFCWVHLFDPHQKYDPPEPFKTKYADQPYNGEVAYVDSSLGRLFRFLEQNGLEERTLVVLTGDHGESLGQHGESTHGYFAYNSSIWVPLVIRHPGLEPRQIDQYVCHVDIFPTVCDILDVDKPSFLQGVSLLPAIRGKSLPKREIYFESLYPFYNRGWAPLQGFIRNAEKYMDSPIPEYYDLDKDFDETENLAGNRKLEAYKSTLAKMTETFAYQAQASNPRTIDREAMEKLRSLGYLSSPQASRKESFTRKDDLKVLLPYQNRLQKAMAAYHKGDVPGGIAILERVIAERKDFDQAYAYLATLYKVQRNFRKAVEILREGYQNCPQSYKVITTFGLFLTEVGEYDAAVNILREGLSLIDYDPDIWNYLGVAFWKKGDYEEALEAFRKSLSLDHNYPIAINNMGSVYLSRFQETKQGRDLEEAIVNFRKAIELDPGYASAFNGLGAAYRYAGNLEGAVGCWERAIELNPEFGFALYNLGLAYLEKGDRIKALEALRKYREQNSRLLSPKERAKLDDLIRKIQKAP